MTFADDLPGPDAAFGAKSKPRGAARASGRDR